MHRSLTLFFTCAALLWSSTCFAVLGELGHNNGANDNPHNLSSLSGNAKEADTETQICIFCHTPHSARANTPLWGRPDPTGPGGGFQIRAGLYISDIVTDTEYSTANDYPNGTSKLCLSCHDGVTAMGILSGNEIVMKSGSDYAAAVELTTSHPISFIYNATVVAYLDTVTPPGSYILPAAGSGYLEIDSAGITRVQCTSCHQPHQDTKGTGSGIYPFWKGDGLASDYDPVCQACHASTPGIPGGIGEHQYNP